MRDHKVYVVHYTQRIAQGTWLAEDDFRITGYSEPEPCQDYYVASSEEVTKAHWDYWARFRGGKENPLVFVRIEALGQPTLLLEHKS